MWEGWSHWGEGFSFFSSLETHNALMFLFQQALGQTHSVTLPLFILFLSTSHTQTHSHTRLALGPLLVTSCWTRIPPHFNAFLSLCLMPAHHALVFAHTYSPLRMYSVQFRTYRHQCVHYMHECIKSMFLLLWWEYRVCVCVQMCREKERREEVCSICALHLLVGMSLNRQGSFRMHMRGEWRVEAVGLWSGGFLVVPDVSGPEPECHIPFSG